MIIRLLLCYLLLLCSGSVSGENYFQKLSKYTTEHGLSDNIILSIFQDASGILWIGTKKGLCSYDGYIFESYPIKEFVNCGAVSFIDQLNKDELVLGTENGNFCFSISNKSYTTLQFLQDHFSPITSLLKSENTTFITSKDGIFQYNTDTHNLVLVKDIGVTCIQELSTGGFLLGSVEKGVLNAQVIGDSINVSDLYHVDNEEVLSVQYAENDVLVILTDKGLWLSSEKVIESNKLGYFTSMDVSKEDGILLGTSEKFIQKLHFVGGKYQLKNYINWKNEVFNDYYDAQVNVLFRDMSGSVWVGTYRAGLDKIDRKKLTYKKFVSKDKEEFSEAGYINGLIQTDDGRIWIGTSGKGLYAVSKEDDELVSVPILNGNMNDLYVEAITHYKDKLYIGTRHMGILCVAYPSFNSEKLTASGQLFSINAGFKKNEYIYNLKKFQDKLYICSANGSFVFDDKILDIRKIDSVPSIDIYIDSVGNDWILSNKMELYYNKKKFELGTEVSDFYVEEEGDVWITTSKGLAHLSKNSNLPYYYNPPGKVIEFTSLAKGENGEFWLGSRMGIYRFDSRSKIFAGYQILGGAKANSFNHGKVVVSPSGSFYFGSNDGVVAIAPNEDYYLPRPLFDVEQDNVTKCIFTVRNYSFNHQEDNGIAYCFSHPDSTWCYLPSDQNILDFSYLSKGKYQIDITAINSDGIINDEVKHFEFKIKRSFNLSALLWFVVCIVLGTYLFFNFKKRRNAHGLVIEEDENLETPEERILREWMSDEFMNKAISLIENKVSDTSYNVNELYDGMQMSKSNFYRKLKTKTDLSPNELIRFIRLVGSTKLLIEAKYSVNEIAYNRGFNSPSYFTRCFKQQYGIAPSEYKKYYENFIKNPE